MSYPISLPLGSVDDSLGILTHPNPALWELELRNGMDNRLSGDVFTHVLEKALDIVEKDWRSTPGAPGAFVIVGRKDQSKFFSNGLNYEDVINDPGFEHNVIYPFFARFMSFPIPTIAAMNGHTFAAGFLIALAADYRVMTSGKAWACLNEINFGGILSPFTAAIVTYKVSNNITARDFLLGAHRFTPQELYKLELVDILTDRGTVNVLAAAEELALAKAPLAKSGVWGLMKKDLSRNVLLKSTLDVRQVRSEEQAALAVSKL